MAISNREGVVAMSILDQGIYYVRITVFSAIMGFYGTMNKLDWAYEITKI